MEAWNQGAALVTYVGHGSINLWAQGPLFTVADGILWLYQSVERNSIVRKLQVVKLRGQASMPGLHTFRITTDGLQVFPRIPERAMSPRPARPSRDFSEFPRR